MCVVVKVVLVLVCLLFIMIILNLIGYSMVFFLYGGIENLKKWNYKLCSYFVV